MIWQLPKKVPQEIKERFPEIHPIILSILYSRGLDTQEKVDEFLLPDYSQDVHNPFLFNDMARAIERLKQARDKKEKVVIYGDFDADGVTSATLLFKAFQKFGLKRINLYLPDRDVEGYGLNEKAVKEFHKKGVNLIVTCDCGVTNVWEVDLANKLGMEVIITDHHLEEEKIPNALAVIDPKVKKEKYPFRDLAGVGVAFKLAQALLSNHHTSESEAFLKWLLDLVAVGTITDRMPLLGENRTLVKYGLVVLNKTSNLGLRALIKKAGLTLDNINSEDISYRLGPRLNVAGRIDHANDALFLLLSKDKEKINFLADKIETMNRKRQKMVDDIILDIKNNFSKQLENKLIFITGESWTNGILGLVANKLLDEYGKPAIIVSRTKKEIKGSGRSHPPLDLFEILNKFKNYLKSFGGHKQAVGFELKDENFLPLLEEGLLKEIAKLKEQKFGQKIQIDSVVKLEDINWDIYEEVKRFAPFGQANEMPKFLVKNIKLTNLETVGQKGEHRRMIFEGGKKMIYFSADASKDLKVGDYYNVVFTLSVNQWNGEQELEMKVIDIKRV